MTDTQPVTPLFGVLAEFEGAEALLRAAAQTHRAGYRDFDVFTPYPVHGMDDAMGLGRSPLGWIVLFCAISGALGALILQWYANAFDYPLVLSGKPYFTWQAFLVVIFEVTVGASAFGAIVGMLLLNGLPRWHHPLFDRDSFARAMDDGFFLFVEARDGQFDDQQTAKFLAEIGAKSIEPVEG